MRAQAVTLSCAVTVCLCTCFLARLHGACSRRVLLDRDAANTALDRIKMTFAEFETPKYKIFEELEQVWDFLKDE